MFVRNLSSHSGTALGKSLWYFKEKKKNYPWHSENQVVGFTVFIRLTALGAYQILALESGRLVEVGAY